MYQSNRGSQMASDSDLIESTVQPNLVDVNDFCKQGINNNDSTSFRTALKPLKWSKIKKKMAQTKTDPPVIEMPQKRIIYVKTFNHVKNEPIIAMAENNLAKTMSNKSADNANMKNWPHNRNKKKQNFDSQVNLDFFKLNKEKFNPLKQNKPKKVPKPKVEEDNSVINDFAFLTGVNIEGRGAEEEEEEEVQNDELEIPEQINVNNKVDESTNNELQNLVDEQRSEKMKRTANRGLNENTNLPSIKRATINNEKPVISVSEERYKKYMNAKPKMFISFKTNSVQPYGRPDNYQDHLVRVYNKEDTPVVQHSLPTYFGPKKDYRKNMLDTYLSQFNLEALREMDEDLYELAKQKMKEKENLKEKEREREIEREKEKALLMD